MPAILRERHLFPPTQTHTSFRREDTHGLQWLHPLAQMYVTDPADQTPGQRTAVLVLSIATPIFAALLLLFILTFRSNAKKREAREHTFAQIGHPQLIPQPAKTYMPHPAIGHDMAKCPPMMAVGDEGPTIPMPEPQINRRPGGTPIGELPSLEVTPPSRPHSVVATPHTPRTLRSPRSPQVPSSPRSPRLTRGHHGVPPSTPFGDVSDQPLSANSLERMITKMESELKSPAPRVSPRRF